MSWTNLKVYLTKLYNGLAKIMVLISIEQWRFEQGLFSLAHPVANMLIPSNFAIFILCKNCVDAISDNILHYAIILNTVIIYLKILSLQINPHINLIKHENELISQPLSIPVQNMKKLPGFTTAVHKFCLYIPRKELAMLHKSI